MDVVPFVARTIPLSWTASTVLVFLERLLCLGPVVFFAWAGVLLGPTIQIHALLGTIPRFAAIAIFRRRHAVEDSVARSAAIETAAVSTAPAVAFLLLFLVPLLWQRERLQRGQVVPAERGSTRRIANGT